MSEETKPKRGHEFLVINPETWTGENWKALHAIFDAQFAPVYQNIGGFENPTVESVDETYITFRCFYDGFDNDGHDEDGEYHEGDDNSWHFTLNRKTGEFDR